MRSREDELRALMLAGLAGDGAAQHRLLAAVAPMLRAFFLRRLGDSAAAEDLVQDCLIAVHTRRESYDRDRPFLPWLYAIARYRLIDLVRRRRVTVPLDGLESLAAEDAFDDEVGAAHDVARLLATLPPKQAAAIRATKLEGLSVAEAAARNEMSESDVRISVHRGLKALARRLGVG